VSAALPEPLQALEIQPPGPESVFNDPIVFLVAGVDARPAQPGGLATVNTDTIMLVRLDPVANDIRVLSVPRDLLIEVTFEDGTTAPGRVNMSFAAGAGKRDSVSAGAENLRNDLENAFGLEVDHWVVVDIFAAERFLDALGGVDVVIPEELAIKSWWYSNNDVDHRLLSFPPGEQHLDGYHAVAFSRLRELDDDLHRIHRQQLVLRAALAQAFSGGLASDPLALWDAYKSTVRTDIPAALAPGYSNLLRRAGRNLTTYSLGDPVDGVASVEDRTLRSGAAVLVGVPEQIAHWLHAFTAREARDENANALPAVP
jgi:LCP family protein required for cell wall assembly